MYFGICGGPEIAPATLAAGYDYFEINISTHLIGEAPDEDFAPILKQIQECGLACRSANVFVPPHLKITGPDVDFPHLTRYVTTVMERAEQVGLQTIVFGSGGARRIPDGFERRRTYAQLIDFGRMVAALAGQYGVVIAVEPLNQTETNVLVSLPEALQYVKDVNCPNFRLLVDAYHWARGSESPEVIIAAGAWLEHVHMATYTNRLPPGAEVCDFTPFLQALQQVGYDKSISIEANWQDMTAQAVPARDVLLRELKLRT